MNIFESPKGLWLPLATPFADGKLDVDALRIMIRHYSTKSISGFILAATTGEGQLLSIEETETLVKTSADEIAVQKSHHKLYLGVSGSDPGKLIDEITKTVDWPLDGYLVCGPNYLRPSQNGLLAFFNKIAASTSRPIIVYNIPYRTGVNIENDVMLSLADIPNIVGVKDCCGSVEQSCDLLRRVPDGFSVLTGEDPFFYNAMVHGAPGAIVTCAHVLVDDYLKIMREIANGDRKTALEIWNRIASIPKIFFEEPNPAPVKYWLYKSGLINSEEVRLPFTPISGSLKCRIDTEFFGS